MDFSARRAIAGWTLRAQFPVSEKAKLERFIFESNPINH
jgi:hypothetical protein